MAHAPTFVGGIFYQDGWLDGLKHNTELAVNLVDNSEGVKKLQISEGQGKYFAAKLKDDYMFITTDRADLVDTIEKQAKSSRYKKMSEKNIVNISINEILEE